MVVHRIWDIGPSDQVGIVWFEKQPDGSAKVLNGYVAGGAPLAQHVAFVQRHGIDASSIDYVRPDAHVRDVRGVSMFDAMKALGLHPEVLPTPLWRSSHPFAETAA